MLNQHFLMALQFGFWPVFVTCITISIAIATRRRDRCMAQTAAAMMLAIAAQTAWEAGQGGALDWWQHFVIDILVFAVVTAPPSHAFQALISGCVGVQIVLDVLWYICHDRTDMARVHWLGTTVSEYLMCLALLLWAGGGRVLGNLASAALDRLSRSRPGMVLASLARDVARQ